MSSNSTPITNTATPPSCDAGLLWAAASSALGLDPADPGYSMGPTPDVPKPQCAGDWAKGCAQRPMTGCTDIIDLWHWVDGTWTYVANIGIPPASCLMRDKGVDDGAIAVFTQNYDQLRDFNLCAYPPPEDVRALISRQTALDRRCRGTADELDTCAERDVLYQQIVAQGWCFDDSNLTVAEWHWHRCGDSNLPIDWERYNAWAGSL